MGRQNKPAIVKLSIEDFRDIAETKKPARKIVNSLYMGRQNKPAIVKVQSIFMNSL